MMVDILLEEDEKLLSSLALQNRDILLTEQARKMFLLCDHNGKGFVIKMDLARIDGMIPNISQQQLELFFDNADIFKTNYITENQFIENIKPMLLRSAFNDSHLTKKSKEGLYLTGSDGVLEENDGKVMKKNEKKKEKEMSGSVMDFDQKEMNEGTKSTRRKSISAVTVTEVDKTLPNEKPSEIIEQRKQNCSGHDRDRDQKHQDLQHQEIYDFTGSLKDELSVAAIGTDGNETFHQAVEPITDYPFTVENTDLSSQCDLPTESSTEIKQNFKGLDDFRKRNRKTTSEQDFHKCIYFPDMKLSPESRSLANPRPDFLPDRIFKVVFVGDSAVGKTCFLHRFCHNRFKLLFNATIGVDFTIKTIRLCDRIVAVQLWDTAGQERFRSITKQYFRKADGIILMYDVTSEQSFLNVRNWITSVKVGVDESCVMCLVGNKVDLFANDKDRVLTYKHGKKLAEEFGMMFFETSAFNGFGVNDCMRAVAM
ncbi:unnamed protein product [Acanthocheilonema viteae]|uniref:EF-hand domain-containing protein n=1 Tax=Acanthocheilonema viteae TaxID=6277 RepID=A0A498RY23_ACAVI|nr:unnamed protein product [Acanthocheilonema viteae]